jgi:putative chitinase
MSFLTRLRTFARSLAVEPRVKQKPVPVTCPAPQVSAKPEPLPNGIKAANEAINATVPIPVAAAVTLPPVTTPGFDRAAFFAVLRNGPLRHRKPEQVAGTEAILDAMIGLPVSWVAYALATAWHETAYTMQPIKERGGRAYFMGRYDKTGNKPHIARDLGNTVEGDGAKFAGRGYVQLTGRRNYTLASKKLGVDLVADPDLAMQPDLAARIMREGMKEGWFITGRGFVAFLPSVGPASLAQFTQARRIINGMDKASKIAGEALAFQAALLGGNWE